MWRIKTRYQPHQTLETRRASRAGGTHRQRDLQPCYGGVKVQRNASLVTRFNISCRPRRIYTGNVSQGWAQDRKIRKIAKTCKARQGKTRRCKEQSFDRPQNTNLINLRAYQRSSLWPIKVAQCSGMLLVRNTCAMQTNVSVS